MDKVKVAKELVKLAKSLVAAQKETSEQEDVKITEMLKDINKQKSDFSQLKNKKCKDFDVQGKQIGNMKVEELVQALHKIITSN